MTLLVIVGSGCQPAIHSDRAMPLTNPTTVPEKPEEAPKPTTLGFRNTNYYLVEEKDYSFADVKDQDVLDEFGNVLTRVSARFRKDLLMEGSGRLLDNRVINYFGKVAGTYRFHATRHPMGRGEGNCALRPFRSIAVDPSQIALGSEVFIDETVGMLLPDGSIHDGIWYAHDTGGAILHDRVDIFVGVKRDSRTLSKFGITHLQPLTIRVLKEPDLFSCVFEPAE